jgi:hypothetical protein
MSYSLWDMLHEDIQNKIIKIRDYELQYDIALNKLTKNVIIDYITNYMKTKHKRITNLRLCKKEELFNLFTKFNIPKIPKEIVLKQKEIVLKQKEIISQSTFDKGIFRYKYENNFDGDTSYYNLIIHIHKITKCYIWVTVKSQFRIEYDDKIWIHKLNMFQYIKFDIFTIYSHELKPIT